MQRRRKYPILGYIFGAAVGVAPDPVPTLRQGCTCAGDVFGHERHCGETPPLVESSPLSVDIGRMFANLPNIDDLEF